jgi:ribosomal protein S18 acetylase RimI-like enzyme
VDCAAAGSATQLAFVGNELVGAIACRLELLPDRSGAFLYVMTVGVLAPFRDRNIGTRLLRHALNEGSNDAFIKQAYLHVQTNNDHAIAFYKRFGFVEDGVAHNYYKRLEPPDAAVLKLDLSRWRSEKIEGVAYGTT